MGNKKIFLLVSSVLLAAGALLAVKLTSKSDKAVQKVETEVEETIVGGDRDEHGCIGSAGYTWCEAKQKCLREWEEPCEQEEIFNLLKNLEEETQIDFSGIAKTEFA